MTSVLSTEDGDYKKASNEHVEKIRGGVRELKQLDQEIQDVINYAVYTFPNVSQRYDIFPKMSQYLPDKLEVF
jgi:hypothetical protein